MSGIINGAVLVLVCTLITISTAQQAFRKEADGEKNETKMANLVADLEKPVVSIRHSTVVPSLKIPLLTKKRTSKFLRRRRHPRRRHWPHELAEKNFARIELPSREGPIQEISDAQKKDKREKLRIGLLHQAWLDNEGEGQKEEEDADNFNVIRSYDARARPRYYF